MDFEVYELIGKHTCGLVADNGARDVGEAQNLEDRVHSLAAQLHGQRRWAPKVQRELERLAHRQHRQVEVLLRDVRPALLEKAAEG